MEYTIRRARTLDCEGAAAVEAACFPAAEAASSEILGQRLKAFQSSFFVAELSEGRIIGLIDGAVIRDRTIRDEMYSDIRLHDEEGAYQSVFGLSVLPEFQKRGVASELMGRMIGEAAARKKRGVILTCKERMISYYSKFGFQNIGVSRSTHGAAIWHDMILELDGEPTVSESKDKQGRKL